MWEEVALLLVAEVDGGADGFLHVGDLGGCCVA